MIYLNARKDIKKSVESNYGEEIKEMIVSQMFRIFHELADQVEIPMEEFEKDLVIRYHGYVAIGLLISSMKQRFVQSEITVW